MPIHRNWPQVTTTKRLRYHTALGTDLGDPTLGSMTVSFWARFHDGAIAPGVVLQHSDIGVAGWWTYANTSTTYRWQFRRLSPTGQTAFSLTVPAIGTGWHFVALVWYHDTSSYRIVFDDTTGTLSGVGTLRSSWSDSNATHHSILTNDTGTFSNNVEMADLRIWQRALTLEEIETLRRSHGKAPMMEGSVIRWPMMEGPPGVDTDAQLPGPGAHIGGCVWTTMNPSNDGVPTWTEGPYPLRRRAA
jgi:hypothetical protein